MLDLELAGLFVTELGIRETVQGLRRAHAVKLENLGRIHRVCLGTAVEDGVANQKMSLFLIQITDPHFKHSDCLSRLLLADHPEAAPTAARPGVDSHSGAGEVGRNPNDRHLDSDRRSTVVDPAALHATFLRHQAAH